MTSLSLRPTVLLAALLLGVAVLPSSLTAQQDSTGVAIGVAPTTAVVVAIPVVKVTPASESGPRFMPVAITSRMPVSAPTPLRYQDGMGSGRNVAMMIVGGAGIVVGSVVGGDGGYIIAVSGAVIGLVGLFRYMR